MRWTGNGLADGVTLTSANVNTAGNGDTVSTIGVSGTGGIVTGGDGFDTWVADAGIRRLDTLSITASKAVVAQVVLTPRSYPTLPNSRLLNVRSASASSAHVLLTDLGEIILEQASGLYLVSVASPALTLNQRFLCDVIVGLSASPTTSNGRLIIRVKNLDNPGWNTTGYWYYDSGYTSNAGTLDLDRFRFGLQSGAIAQANPLRMEQLGWDFIASDITGVTGLSNVESYFMSDPYAAPPTPPAGSGWQIGSISM